MPEINIDLAGPDSSLPTITLACAEAKNKFEFALNKHRANMITIILPKKKTFALRMMVSALLEEP